MMTDRELSPAESLRLIEAMIQRSSQRLRRASWLPFLVWGYTSVGISLLIYVLVPLLGYKANFFWLGIPIIGALGMQLGGESIFKSPDPEGRTPIDRFVNVIWTVLGINAMLCSILAPGRYILFIILLLMSIGAMMTALATRFRLLVVTSAIGMLMSYGMIFLLPGSRLVLLYFALAFAIVFIVPGHVLRRQFKQSSIV